MTVCLFGLAITEPIPVTIAEQQKRRFPAVAGILLGLGLGGFFDGIVLHQILQWHHMATSSGYPADTLENLQLNTTLDGLFSRQHLRIHCDWASDPLEQGPKAAFLVVRHASVSNYAHRLGNI